jgi:hypothetical protein
MISIEQKRDDLKTAHSIAGIREQKERIAT